MRTAKSFACGEKRRTAQTGRVSRAATEPTGVREKAGREKAADAAVSETVRKNADSTPMTAILCYYTRPSRDCQDIFYIQPSYVGRGQSGKHGGIAGCAVRTDGDRLRRKKICHRQKTGGRWGVFCEIGQFAFVYAQKNATKYLRPIASVCLVAYGAARRTSGACLVRRCTFAVCMVCRRMSWRMPSRIPEIFHPARNPARNPSRRRRPSLIFAVFCAYRPGNRPRRPAPGARKSRVSDPAAGGIFRPVRGRRNGNRCRSGGR